MNSSSVTWISLVLSLPAHSAAARMRIWRRLKGLGCAALRDGVYLLPGGDGRESMLSSVAGEVRAEGGNAEVLFLQPDEEQKASFTRLFDRSAEYAAWRDELTRLGKTLKGPPDGAWLKAFRSAKRGLEQLIAIDFFPNEARRRAESAFAALERLAFQGEPVFRTGMVECRDRGDYQGRLWATRRRPWVDRLASAWLIVRFIDPAARFLWLSDPTECPEGALGFDFDGATFTHLGDKVTFEVLQASFALDEPALNRIGALVHDLDVGGGRATEGEGVEILLKGLLASRNNDDALLADGLKVFDWLWLGSQERER